jgi:hypothetical protein
LSSSACCAGAAREIHGQTTSADPAPGHLARQTSITCREGGERSILP